MNFILSTRLATSSSHARLTEVSGRGTFHVDRLVISERNQRNMTDSRKINPDLQRERDNCTFDVTELTYLIDGGAQKTEERRKRGNLFSITF